MNPPDHADPFAALDEQAALWAGRLAGRALTADERRELAAWLAADSRHRAALTDYVRLSRDAERVLPQLAALGRVELPAAPLAAPRLAWLTGGALVAAALALAFVFFSPRPSTFAPSQLATAAGQHTAHALADGSQVDLNARTTLTAAFTADERRVRLAEGEAFFAVAKDAARPFVVETAAGEVRVTGTKFNVRLEAADTVEVTVLEGSVLVSGPGGASRKLAPGDQLVLRAGVPDLRKLPLEQLQDAVAWLQGRVIFSGTHLREAAARVAHYHGVKIEVADAVAEIELGGAYPIADLEGFLKRLENLDGHPLRVARDGDVVRIAAPAPRQ